MASAASIKHALTIVVQTSIIVSIICFVECRNVVYCAKYGHACWGAHGKRSDIADAPILLSKPSLSESPQNRITPSFETQWLLSRLVAGQPVLPLMDKYRVGWSTSAKDKTYVPIKWEHYASSTGDEDPEPIRAPINENGREIDSAKGMIRGTNEIPGNTARILLVSPDELINDPQNLDVL